MKLRSSVWEVAWKCGQGGRGKQIWKFCGRYKWKAPYVALLCCLAYCKQSVRNWRTGVPAPNPRLTPSHHWHLRSFSLTLISKTFDFVPIVYGFDETNSLVSWILIQYRGLQPASPLGMQSYAAARAISAIANIVVWGCWMAYFSTVMDRKQWMLY